MTINKLKELGLIKFDTLVTIRVNGGYFHSKFETAEHYDPLYRYIETPLTSFIWQDDNNVYVDID